jgi:hypothetical protein
MREEMDLIVENGSSGNLWSMGFRTYAKPGFSPSQFIQICLKALPKVIQY